MRPLHQCLLDTHLIRLRVIARFWDVELTTNRQREAAFQLAEAMCTPEAVATAWNALSGDQRQALAALLAAEGRMPLRVFTRQWGEIRTMGPGRLERERPWEKPVSTAEGLWYSGFISRAFAQGPGGAYEAVFVPPELQALLPAPPPAPPAIAIEPTTPPPIVRPAGDAFLDDACTLLAYLQNERVHPKPDGSWPTRHQTHLIRQLRDPHPTRLALLHHLPRRLAWLRTTESALLRPEPQPVATWLRSPAEQQRNTLAEAWREDPTWNDLFHVPTIVPEQTGAWRNDPLLARKAILRHVQTCTPNEWYSLEDFVIAIQQADPDFQRPSGDYSTWYIRDSVSGEFLSGFESWDRVEGALIRHLITGPLNWLGLIQVGGATLDQPPTAFRLTSAGASFLGLSAPPPESEAAPLVLRPDFTVLTPPPRRYERFQLARVADWVSSPPVAPETKGKQDRFVYRLTSTSLERAREQGISVRRVLEFLERTTGTPVPSFVEAALTGWETRGAEARLERVWLLRLSSEELMNQVMSSPLTRRLIRERLGPTQALVRERDRSRLVTALGKMGILLNPITSKAQVDAD